MLLAELLGCIGIETPIQREVKDLVIDSRKVSEESVFVALRGGQQDGHDFLPAVCARGAIAVVVESVNQVPTWYWGQVVQVADARKALSQLAAHLFGHPTRELFCVGVTGTNGKTTLTHMVEHLFNEAQIPTAVMGTIDHHFRKRVWASELTTPDSVTLLGRCREFCQLGAKALAMECSSHALKQGRVAGVEFDVVVFTNFTRDHLDYHPDMGDYFLSKQKLFTEVLAASGKRPLTVVLNADDEQVIKTEVFAEAQRLTFGSAQGADFRYQITELGFEKAKFILWNEGQQLEFELPVTGKFNVANAVASLAVAKAKGVELENCRQAFLAYPGVRGRVQRVTNARGVAVFVDYAHTPDALTNVLRSIREVIEAGQTARRVITVFGCGGDRDAGKRPLMMRAALEFSDQVILTSDNPRNEDPEQIMRDSLLAVTQAEREARIVCEVDRRLAITQALRAAGSHDVVLIAGKGHENYQIIGTDKLPFSDVSVAEEVGRES